MAPVRKYDHNLTVPKDLMGMRPLDRDKLAAVSRQRAADAAQLALFQLQDIHLDSRDGVEVQVMGVGILFAVMCQRCGLQPSSLYDMATRLLDAPDEFDATTSNSLQVLKDFIAARVMAKEVSIG